MKFIRLVLNITEFQSLNSSLENISQSIITSNNIELTTIVSIGLNAVLAVVVIFQLLLYRNDIKSRLRPWLGRLDSNDSIKLVPAKNNQSPLMIFAFKNNGEMPALNIDFSRTIVSPTEFKNKLIFESEGKKFSLGKNETWYHRTILTDEDIRLAMTSNFYYAFQVKYTDKNKIKGLFEIHGHWVTGIDTFDSIIIE